MERQTTGTWPPAGPKGQAFRSWTDSGEWHHDPERALRYWSLPLGVDDDGASTRIVVVRYEPGAEVGPHHHRVDYCSIVVEGSIEVTRRQHGVGSMRFVKAGTVYGPLRAGPDGCTIIDVFASGRGDPDAEMGTFYA